MIVATALHEQLEAQREDRLRILIVGAGVAGVTLAALLRKQGLHPVVIERMHTMAHPGYMLALMPTVDPIIADLGIRDEYLAHSAPMSRYAFHSHRGKPLRNDDLGALLSAHGDYRGIERGILLELLSAGDIPVSFGTTVGRIAFGAGDSTVDFTDSDGAASFDLVVAADGVHSRTRDLLPIGKAEELDTGWGGWVSWCDPMGDPGTGDEVWGDGFFLGVYPVKDRLGVFLGGPTDETVIGAAAFADRVRAAAPALGERLRAALDAVAGDSDPYFWPLADVRSEHWVAPGAVVLGDAAAGFLPTAGVGAAMAMESAWMLGRMLSHTDRADLAQTLAEWERIEKPRVEAAQANSRMLARLMFRRGRVVAWLRETVMRMITVKAALGPIIRLIADQPDPEAAAERALSGR
jgi:2-polyprenyl-6-methoxyphenol hydroxylase-like FAD-dependent oxidoreductase